MQTSTLPFLGEEAVGSLIFSPWILVDLDWQEGSLQMREAPWGRREPSLDILGGRRDLQIKVGPGPPEGGRGIQPLAV